MAGEFKSRREAERALAAAETDAERCEKSSRNPSLNGAGKDFMRLRGRSYRLEAARIRRLLSTLPEKA